MKKTKETTNSFFLWQEQSGKVGKKGIRNTTMASTFNEAEQK